MKTFLPLLIAVPLAVLAGYTARYRSQALPPPAAHELSGKPAALPARPAAAASIPPAPVERTEASREDAAPAPAASTSPAPLPAPPPATFERTAELRQWLLALPSADIARLSGTAEMDAYVGRIVGEFQASAAENPDAIHDLDQFLKEINAAILRAKSER